MKQQVHLYISGEVQGVALRYGFSHQARLLGLVGWIKNLDNGRVEAVVQGEEENIKKILEWLPSYARIDDIEIKKETPENLRGFEVRF